MNRFLLFIFIIAVPALIFPGKAFAQTPEDIEAQLDSIPETKDQVIALLKAARSLNRTYPQSSVEFAQRAVKKSVEMKNVRLGAEAFSTLGAVLMNQGKYSEAIIPLKKAVTYRQRFVKKEVRQNRKLAEDYHLLGIAYERLGKYKEADARYERQKFYALKSPSSEERAKAFHNLGKSALRKKKYSEALGLLKQAKYFAKQANLKRTLLEIDTNIRTASDLMQSSLSAKEFERELKQVSENIETVQDSLNTAIETNEVLLNEKEYLELEGAKKEAELKLVEDQRKLVEKEKERLEAVLTLREVERRNYQIILISGVFVGILLLWIALTMWQRALERKKSQKEIQDEKERADKLLVNILPEKIADELKEKELVEPVEHPKVTILFTDFKGFTRLAAGMSPKELLEHLEYAFHHFDNITTKYGLEKIKTIGDAYMAVGGLVKEDPYQGINSVAAGMEMQEFMKNWNVQQRQKGEPEWHLRVGIHTGKVVAGVIGKKKFAYDVWGDDVNVAARMESASDPGRVNISEATYAEVAPFVKVEPKRTVPIKNRGEVGMYFIERITARRTQPANQ
ncbi:MAG: tetratricopeptide repeat protein [Bacteroidia bacterium]|nr:tetratricopeptide repeat protein [Bacteroidia bacterium]